MASHSVQIRRDTIGLTLNGSLMRLYVAQPQPEGRWPGLLFYSDIFSLVIRSRARRIA
ncbi:dienelactone hydrolase family protein [Synechococcus sp. WH 7805]|uniref:hypothetical protein n=1 Tax=Synechococcus sp. WH 8017 TaxID=166321 RepID=UPI00006BA027|nr:dienelactone hydrolase family protein [Synechococcus sp. WH 7805]